MAKSTKLVEIFFYLSEACEKELKFSSDRFTNNYFRPFSKTEFNRQKKPPSWAASYSWG
jgi:hypothetical protein